MVLDPRLPPPPSLPPMAATPQVPRLGEPAPLGDEDLTAANITPEGMAAVLRGCGILRQLEYPSRAETSVTVSVHVQMVSKAGLLWTKPATQLPRVTFSTHSVHSLPTIILDQVRWVP